MLNLARLCRRLAPIFCLLVVFSVNAEEKCSREKCFGVDWTVAMAEEVKEVDVNLTRADSGGTPLHWAATFTPYPQVIRVLVENGGNINKRMDNGYQPLHLAALNNGNGEVIDVMVLLGAMVNGLPNALAPSPLHEAAIYGNATAVRALLANGAAVNLRTSYGETPLHLATSFWHARQDARSHSDVILLLLDAGADAELKDDNGKSSWDIAKDKAKEKESFAGTEAYKKLRNAACLLGFLC